MSLGEDNGGGRGGGGDGGREGGSWEADFFLGLIQLALTSLTRALPAREEFCKGWSVLGLGTVLDVRCEYSQHEP